LCNSSDHNTNLCPYYACYTQPYVASPWDNTDVVLCLHDSSFPLAQRTGLEAGELFGVVTRFDVADACFKLEDILNEVHDLDETPLKGSRDVFMHEASPNPGFGIPLIILMFPPCVHYPLLPLSITLTCPLKIL